MYDLAGFQRDLLYVTASLDEPCGFAIKDQLEDYYGTEVHRGRLYPSLGTLVEEGLLDKGEKDRRANVYTVTARGHRKIGARDDWGQQYTSELTV